MREGARRAPAVGTRALAALAAALVLGTCPAGAPTRHADAAGIGDGDSIAGAPTRGEAGSGFSGTAAGWLRLPDPARSRYAGHIREASRRYGVSAALVEAVIRVESAFNPFAVSQKGARGLMQLMPGTAQALGVQDSFDPRENIEGGVRHLRNLIDRYPGDLPRVLAAYNAGAGAVDFYRGIPPFSETRQYIEKVMQNPGVTTRVAIATAAAGDAPGASGTAPADVGSTPAAESSSALSRRLVVGPGQPLPALPLIEQARKAGRTAPRDAATDVSVRAGDGEPLAGSGSITDALARMRDRGLLRASAKRSPARAR
jgi:hypothetical protein